MPHIYIYIYIQLVICNSKVKTFAHFAVTKSVRITSKPNTKNKNIKNIENKL